MKQHFLLLCTLTLLNVYGHAQSFFPSVFDEPLTGLNLLRDENPYILKQLKTSNPAWTNSKLFVKKRAPNTNYLILDRTANWVSANWKDEQLTKDSFVLDNNNRIATIFEEAKNIYNGTTYYNKNKYFYSYDSENRLGKISVQTASSPTSTNYADNYVYVINYTNGVRTSDSIYVVANEASYVRAYSYNNTGKLITESGIQSGDTVARTDYNYEAGLLKSIIASEFSETADAWEINQTDSFEYNSNNLIVQHTIWSSYTSNSVFSPIVKEKYGYTSNNKLNEIIVLLDTNSVWKNKSKIVVTYDNTNKATIAYGYNAIDENTWGTEATEKYIFDEVTTGVKLIAKPATELNVYPNPAANEINIAALPNSTLYLFDVSGKLVLSTEVGNSKVDVSGLDNGIYTAQLVNALNNTSAVSKIVISK
ncbi:MAG: T9SS type A sorting domain-containing protein [Bacteroidota bacterium]